MRGSLLSLVLALSMWAPSPAFAHGVLERSSPSTGAALDRPPSLVTLMFSEPVDSEFSTVAVVDRDGRHFEQPASVSRDGRQMTVGLRAMAVGVYTVRWRVLSVADGHISSGFFAFGIGEAPPADAAGTPTAALDLPAVAARWIGYLSALLVAGIVLFQALVLRPAIAAVRGSTALDDPRLVPERLRRVAAVAAGVLLASVIAEFVAQAATLLGAPATLVTPGGRLLVLLTESRVGWAALVRAVAAVTLLVSLVWRPGPPATVGSVAASGVLLAGITVTAHAAGRGLVAVAADWVHLAGGAVWIGGLAGLLIAAQATPAAGRPRFLRAIVPRFARAAVVCLGAVMATGLYGARLYLPGLNALATTPYGRALGTKLLLVLPLISLGAVSRFVLRPLLEDARIAHPPVRRFLTVVAGEVGVGLALLLVVAVLTLTPPPSTTSLAAGGPSLVMAGIAEDIRMRVTLTPAQPGWNRLDIAVADPEEAAVTPGSRVLVRLLKLDEDLDPRTVRLESRGQGRYTIAGYDLGLPGWWEVEVIVRRVGRLDVAAIFPLRLGAPVSPARDAEARRFFERVQRAVARVRTWRETQQLTDGSGNVYLTWLEAERPYRQRFRTSTGVEVIGLGAVRYQRSDGGPWKRYTFARPVAVEGPLYYMRDAEGIRFGRSAPCDDEPCRVLLWDGPGQSAGFAAWVGTRSLRVHRLLMLEPTHYMTLHVSGINEPVRIAPP